MDGSPHAAGPVLAFLDPRLMWATGLLVGTLVLGAVVIALARRWRGKQGEHQDPGSELSRYRALFEKGEISEEEFNRVRDVLRVQMRAALGAGKPNPAVAPPRAVQAQPAPSPESIQPPPD